MKSRLVLSLGLSIGAVGVKPGVIRTANETGEITLVCGHDALVGEHLGPARHDLEQLTGAGVVVRRCPGGALQQSDPLIAERTAGRAAACVQPAGHWRAAADFGFTRAHHHDVVRWHLSGHARHLIGVAARPAAAARRDLQLTRLSAGTAIRSPARMPWSFRWRSARTARPPPAVAPMTPSGCATVAEIVDLLPYPRALAGRSLTRVRGGTIRATGPAYQRVCPGTQGLAFD